MMMDKITELYQKYLSKYVNRETITYLISGVLTTIVNYVTYVICSKVFEIDKYMSNIIAWIIAVLFAYVVNDIWVFKSIRNGLVAEIAKIIKFFAARVFSLLVEVLGLYVFTTLMSFNDLIVKAGLAVIVIILNYFFSKLFIFNKKN